MREEKIHIIGNNFHAGAILLGSFSKALEDKKLNCQVLKEERKEVLAFSE